MHWCTPYEIKIKSKDIQILCLSGKLLKVGTEWSFRNFTNQERVCFHPNSSPQGKLVYNTHCSTNCCVSSIGVNSSRVNWMQLIKAIIHSRWLYSNVNQGIFQPNAAYTQQSLNISRWKCSKLNEAVQKKILWRFLTAIYQLREKIGVCKNN